MKMKSGAFLCFLLCAALLLLASCSSQEGSRSAAEFYSDAPLSAAAAAPQIDRSGGYEVQTEEMYFESSGGRVYAVLYYPSAQETARPAVIFSHRYSGTHRSGGSYAEALASQGYIVCCPDFRGGGPDSRSDGSTLDMTVFTELDDLETVLAALYERDDVDKSNIFLMGNSQGGVVSALAAVRHVDEIAGMVLSSPAFSMSDDARRMFESTDAVPETYEYMQMTVGRGYFTSIMDYDLYAAVSGYDGPVLIFHGDGDTLVPISYSERAADTLPNASLEVLRGEGHIYSQAAVQRVIEMLSGFFAEHLRASQAPDAGRQTGLVAEQILNGDTGEIHYSYYLPEGYSSGRRYPLIMAMPGYDMMWFGEGSSGSNLNWRGFLCWTELDEDMIVVSAQLTDWGETSARQAIELTEYFIDNFSVDTDRVYAAGYSAGGETMSRAVSMRPDLYTAYLHGASRWDGSFEPIAENGVAVYIFMAQSDEYYGSQRAVDAYNGLYAAYEAEGWTEEQINSVLHVEIPGDAYFNERGITGNYHGGGNILFEDEEILNWIISHSK